MMHGTSIVQPVARQCIPNHTHTVCNIVRDTWLQVKMQAVGDTLLVHRQPVASADAPRTLELRVPDYVTETPSALQDLLLTALCSLSAGFDSYAECVTALLSAAHQEISPAKPEEAIWCTAVGGE